MKIQIYLPLIVFLLCCGPLRAAGDAPGGNRNGTGASVYCGTMQKRSAFPLPFSPAPLTMRGDTLPPAEAHPDSIPYSVDPSLGRQLLKAPAAVFHLAILPIKWGMIWSQEYRVYERVSDILMNDDRTAGFYPNFTIGGRTPFAAGITYFNRDLFNSGHSLDFNTFYTNPGNFNLGIYYQIPPARRQRYQLAVSGNLRKNDSQNIFLGGNGGSDEDLASYQIEQYDLEAELGYLLRPNILATIRNGLIHTYVHDISSLAAENGPMDRDLLESERFNPGKATLFNTGIGITVDGRKGLSENRNTSLISTVTTSYDFKQTKTRVYSGGLYDAGIYYNRDLSTGNFEYLNYFADWHQFFPVPGLPLNRRLAFRARLHKRYPLGDGSVPFYEQSILGDAGNLRGYQQDRFRNLGSLLLTLEYRYPVWDTWDAVLFTDQGQVFNKYTQIGLKRFHGSVGTGLRFMSASDFLFRVEIAFSKEGARSLMEFSMNF